jgi:sulfatase maturation enzyme AslB (radical SAM superfamily)
MISYGLLKLGHIIKIMKWTPHDFHEVKIRNPESICSKCTMETSQVCEWSGVYYKCHKVLEIEKESQLGYEGFR